MHKCNINTSFFIKFHKAWAKQFYIYQIFGNLE